MSGPMDTYDTNNGDRYDDDTRYDRDQRSASPGRPESGRDSTRRRSASPNGNGPSDRGPKEGSAPKDHDEGSLNTGSNLFVTGIAPNLTEAAISRMFEKYGEVEKCQIMRDPHTKESRGFGFVNMATSDQADAAKEGLSGEVVEGRTFSIEKARRSRPRTPTPGKYFGPPKRAGGPSSDPRRFNDRYEDRRRGGGYGNYSRDDPYRYRGYERRYEDRGPDRRYDDRSYGGGRDYERGGYDDRGYDRSYRGGGGSGGGSGYDRRDRGDDAYYGGSGSGGMGGRDRYREDRDRSYGGARGAPADERRGPGYERERGYDRPEYDRGSRSRDVPPASAGYGDSRPEGRDTYAGS